MNIYKTFINKYKNEKKSIILKQKRRFCKIFFIIILGCFIVVVTGGISNSILNDKNNIISYLNVNNYETNNIDFLKIANESSYLIKKEELKTENQDIDYKTYYTENDSLLKGTSRIIQPGKEGIKQTIIKITYEGNEFVSEDIISETVLKKPKSQIIEIGTKEKGKKSTKTKNDFMYVNINALNVREKPEISSEKIGVLNKNDKVKILKNEDLWTKIKIKNLEGWILSEYLTDNAFFNNYSSTLTPRTKQDLLLKLNFNMNLYEPSGLTYEQFKKVLSGNKQDKNKIIESNADYFYYAEQQYKINGIFLAAVAIHESGWGTSKISLDKKNLFGYGAYDGSAYQSAWTFDTYAEGIDLLARVLIKYYLSPNGRYYNGPTLTGVNTRYATDKANANTGKTKGWAEKVYSYMQVLYNKV